jgi:hypothetical protein
LRIPRLCQLLNVVHHAVQVPLRVDLLAPTVVEADQPLVVPDVGKHRLHGARLSTLQCSHDLAVGEFALFHVEILS